jgi:hypothetical protein
MKLEDIINGVSYIKCIEKLLLILCEMEKLLERWRKSGLVGIL